MGDFCISQLSSRTARRIPCGCLEVLPRLVFSKWFWTTIRGRWPKTFGWGRVEANAGSYLFLRGARETCEFSRSYNLSEGIYVPRFFEHNGVLCHRNIWPQTLSASVGSVVIFGAATTRSTFRQPQRSWQRQQCRWEFGVCQLVRKPATFSRHCCAKRAIARQTCLEPNGWKQWRLDLAFFHEFRRQGTFCVPRISITVYSRSNQTDWRLRISLGRTARGCHSSWWRVAYGWPWPTSAGTTHAHAKKHDI